ncbi:MAG TPA: hypothetical protein VN612_15520 [Acidobacteriaceae bacterium]|nr:hypothetical protein [Acidobacteriaceae bacterium]
MIAPDVRELKVRVSSIERQMETQYTSLRAEMQTQHEASRNQQDANFKALMAAISESKAKSELDTFRLIAALTERVAALESARQ